MASYLFVDCVFIFAMFAAAFVLQRQRHRPPLPPGPKRLPLIGNLLNRPTRYLHLAYTDMKSQFGDLMSLEVLGQPFIVVNSIKVANELFEKRSANYADRPGASLLSSFTSRASQSDYVNTRIPHRQGLPAVVVELLPDAILRRVEV